MILASKDKIEKYQKIIKKEDDKEEKKNKNFCLSFELQATLEEVELNLAISILLIL